MRLVLVFVVAWLAMAGLAGTRVWAPSSNAHYLHLADAWLHGRTHHDGRPPGYCGSTPRSRGECDHHTFDDWAVVWTLRLRDGGELRGFPCRTRVCAERRRASGQQTWWILGEGWRRFPPGTIVSRHETWYVSFPPGPAVLMLPWVAWFGPGISDVLITCALAAVAATLLLHLLESRVRLSPAASLAVVAAWTLGSPACVLGSNGQVWFTAQIAASMALLGYLGAAWDAKRPGLAGVWLAAAISCRPTVALAAFFGIAELVRHRARPRAWARFLAPCVLGVTALMVFNWVRFADPWEFGHRYLEIRWQERMQTDGMFSLAYLGRNLECLLTLLPRVDGSPPSVRVSVHGIALWLASPWLLGLAWSRRPFPQRSALWIAAALTALPPLLYHNSGQLQFSYRFALDWLPMVVVAGAAGGLARRPGRFAPLVAVSLVVNVYAAYMFGRHPTELFVTDPVGWPFENEFR